jgi:hypothetical protein
VVSATDWTRIAPQLPHEQGETPGEVSLCEGGVSKSFWQAEFVRVECTLSLPSVYIADFRAGCSNSRAARMLLS